MKNALLALSLLIFAPSVLAQVPTNSFAITSSGAAAQPQTTQLRPILPDGRFGQGRDVVASDGTNLFDALGYDSSDPNSLYAMNSVLDGSSFPDFVPAPRLYRIDLESGLTTNLGEIKPPARLSFNPLGDSRVGLTLNFIGTGGDNANYFVVGLVLDFEVRIFPFGLRSVSNPRLYVGEISLNSGDPSDPDWRLADTSDPATTAIINGYVEAINQNPNSPNVTGGPRDWVFMRENGEAVLKSYLGGSGQQGQFLTVRNIGTRPVVTVTTPAVQLPVQAEIGAMFSGANNTLFAVNTDGGLTAGEIYQIDATTGNYLNVTLNSGIGLFRGDATTIIENEPLPVTLTSFEARSERATVALRWATATEEGTDRFRVERSTNNGQTWAALGEVKAANAPQGRTYSFVDQAPETGLNYYRLHILDFDGSVAYSPVQGVDFQPAQLSITLYPNPAQDQVAVELPQVAAPGSTLQVHNSLGQQIWTQRLEGQRTVRVNTQTWAAGVYHVKVLTNGRSETQRLVIQP